MLRDCPPGGGRLKRFRKRYLVLAAVIGLYGALVLSSHGVLFWLTDTSRPPLPKTSEESHGVIPTFRCHYFTGTGTFSVETSMGFGAEVCSVLKHKSRAG
ncbi:hypothetical protein [Brevundimonas sp. Root1279]|uniref:hypothetical protein n=1 Tax=Brevundimonas sp. Root1279 TaxID=1736443 RepID=UPI0007151346|nr:hypothetical protein [Brevundimonas sp. Root1279]KQW86508.1 hypothetical protein ASC65_01005 [Brevundimonas sp. Root1279]